ncbi:Site-specific recombinase XerD [Sphingomonas guangdongensis]|uniref:Site-specific recombinase XerD n=1 Tax=Sphingomonas guangdongensis TaxID=1141890 RepID=A0A285R2I0_9SPHN|nr:site-specific integrase [Sphingomonas guangdongensis]SOB88305.1 Site-specific recombinase XerD [Sphingomonas guangdongensis]
MASIRKRSWTGADGAANTAWLVDYRDSAGKRRAKQFARKRDAEAWATQASWHVSQGTHTPDSQSITVAKACELWIERAVADGLEESTLQGYRARARLHICPLIGEEKLSRLTRPHVEAFADTIVETRGKAMAVMILRALSSAIGEAQRRGLVAQNVAAGVRVKRAKRDRERVEIPTKDELRAILKAASDRERPLVMTAVFTGLRASELRGLRWSDVDLKAGRLTVSQRADAFNVIGSPKSAAGRRAIPLPAPLVAELKRWKLACPVSELGLAFPNGVGRIETHSNLLQRMFGPLQVRAGVIELDGEGAPTWRYGFHALRHAAASMWIERGTDPKRIQTWLGHASIQLTFDTYGHLFEAAATDAAVVSAIAAELIG